MRLTKRGRILAYALAILLGATLGFTAELWNPISRELTSIR